MNNMEKEILLEMAKISGDTNKKIIEIADKYGIDRNVAVRKYIEIYATSIQAYDLNKR